MREKTQRWAVLSFSCAVLLCLVIFICKDTPGLYPAATTCSVWTGSKHESLVSASSEYKEISETAESGNQLHNSEKVNINTASWEELTALDGIGDVLAKRIVAYREQNGPFSSAEDLMEISGIGEKKFQAIREQITVS